MYEQAQNSQGIPFRVATDPANAGFFEVDDSTIDHSMAALREWEQQNTKPDPGVMPVVTFDERAKKASEARRAKRREAGQNTT